MLSATGTRNKGPMIIKWQIDSRGYRRAYRWSRLAGRYVQMAQDTAKLLLATGRAVES